MLKGIYFVIKEKLTTWFRLCFRKICRPTQKLLITQIKLTKRDHTYTIQCFVVYASPSNEEMALITFVCSSTLFYPHVR